MAAKAREGGRRAKAARRWREDGAKAARRRSEGVAKAREGGAKAAKKYRPSIGIAMVRAQLES